MANQCFEALMLTIMLHFTVRIFDKHTGHGRSVGSLVCSISGLLLLGLFIDSMVRTL
jgi:hypothetical protein